MPAPTKILIYSHNLKIVQPLPLDNPAKIGYNVPEEPERNGMP